MTNEEQNIAVAEFMRVKWHKPTDAEKASGSYYQYEPDYGKDLNAMHEAELKLNEKEEWPGSYILNLSLVIDSDFDFRLLTATASQRREALLRTIGKWKD